MTVSRRAIALAAAALIGAGAPAFAASTLAPYQMVRSLQLVQDRIAGGDHAALPMQNKLLGMIDRRMRAAEPDEFADIRNFNALLVYGMSGGNPKTIDLVLAKLPLEGVGEAIGAGVLDFLRGQPAKARERLAAVDPMSQPIELGAFLALVKGSVTGPEEPDAAMKFFDQARLLGPGTLVEEAALRRSMPLAIETKDAPRFLKAASNYVRYYLRSPYASEFAHSFVNGVIELQPGVDMEAVDRVIAGMARDQQEAIYLRLARKGAIDGMPALSAFASAKVLNGEKAEDEDPRAILYSSMTTITSETISEVAERLKRIDRARLSGNDRKLLEAVEAVVAEVLVAPARGAMPEDIPAAEEAVTPLPSEDSAAPAQAAEQTEVADEKPSERVADARQRIADIDKLLGETAE